MFVVKFYENKNLLVTQFLRNIPKVGEPITIKGHKGKVSSVNEEDEANIQIQVAIEKMSKTKLVVADQKKKKR